MLYSKFGSRLTPVSKSQDANGRITIQATAEDTTDVRDHQITDLKADDGSTEINEIISKLPAKVIQNIPTSVSKLCAKGGMAMIRRAAAWASVATMTAWASRKGFLRWATNRAILASSVCASVRSAPVVRSRSTAALVRVPT